MEYLYLFIVMTLIVFAISDLVVGVSNDAVNFVNSAVGSKAATFRTIMIIAALGVLVGSVFSSGMMEVARKGIFNPENFYFNEIMFIFLAVMITDVILLDLFNTAGLPTSTTVSLIFELLGASMAISLMKILAAGGAMADLGGYINSGKVIAIITGILISIGIAFSVGALIQYIVRLIFTFNFQQKLKYFGSTWGGIAISIMVYFLFIKGAKGSSFMSKELVEWFNHNTWLILAATFIGFTIILQFLLWFTKVNILKIIVLVGTFCLAMAFAGNDLVNFIGVPLAGLDAFLAMKAAGANPESFSMEMLNNPVTTPTFFLLIAGVVMVLTLFLSAKARKVTKTEVSLGSQSEGDEMFQSSMVSRGIVNFFLMLNDGYKKVVPAIVREKIDTRFSQSRQKRWKSENLPAFDLVRASVNLMVSSMLIALGTSLKLPLSTTYVTFMVAMATSMSDRAWGRESAVYRVNGVITVIGGWFFTAFSAFTAAFLFALAIYYGGIWSIIGLIGLALFFAYRTNIYMRKKSREEKREAEAVKVTTTEYSTMMEVCDQTIVAAVPFAGEIYHDVVDAFIGDHRKKIFKQEAKLKELMKRVKLARKQLHPTLRNHESENTGTGIVYLNAQYALKESCESLQQIFRQIFDYMINRHTPVQKDQSKLIRQLNDTIAGYVLLTADLLKKREYSGLAELDKLLETIFAQIDEAKKEQIFWMKENESGTRLSLLIVEVLQESRIFAEQIRRLADMQHQFYLQAEKSTPAS